MNNPTDAARTRILKTLCAESSRHREKLESLASLDESETP